MAALCTAVTSAPVGPRVVVVVLWSSTMAAAMVVPTTTWRRRCAAPTATTAATPAGLRRRSGTPVGVLYAAAVAINSRVALTTLVVGPVAVASVTSAAVTRRGVHRTLPTGFRLGAARRPVSVPPVPSVPSVLSVPSVPPVPTTRGSWLVTTCCAGLIWMDIQFFPALVTMRVPPHLRVTRI